MGGKFCFGDDTCYEPILITSAGYKQTNEQKSPPLTLTIS